MRRRSSRPQHGTRGPLSLGLALSLAIPALVLAAPLGVAAPPAPPTDAPEGCEGGVCVNMGEAKWTPEESVSRKTRNKDRKRYRKRKPVGVTVKIVGGRGSVFIDGEWAGEAPVSGFELKPGHHEVQVRDGETVLGDGVLMIYRKSGDVELSVSHPDAEAKSW